MRWDLLLLKEAQDGIRLQISGEPVILLDASYRQRKRHLIENGRIFQIDFEFLGLIDSWMRESIAVGFLMGRVDEEIGSVPV